MRSPPSPGCTGRQGGAEQGGSDPLLHRPFCRWQEANQTISALETPCAVEIRRRDVADIPLVSATSNVIASLNAAGSYSALVPTQILLSTKQHGTSS